MARTGRKVKGATGKLKSQSKKRLFENPITWSIIIGLLTLIILFPSVQNGFTNWDDDLYVLENNLVINSEKYAINDYFTTYIAGRYAYFMCIQNWCKYFTLQCTPPLGSIFGTIKPKTIQVVFVLLRVIQSTFSME